MGATLHLGDCLGILPQYPDGSADALIIDPPFAAAGGSTNGMASVADTQFFRHWLTSVLAECRRVVRPEGCGFIFCDWRTIGPVQLAMTPLTERRPSVAWTVTQAIVWDRESMGMGSPFRNSFEMIAFAKGPAFQSVLPKTILNVIHHRWPYGAHEFHQAEKPVDLCRQLVRWALPSGRGVVLDAFMGSGTVGVAAEEEGVDYIGIEMEPDVYEIAEKRIEHAKGGSTPRAQALFR